MVANLPGLRAGVACTLELGDDDLGSEVFHTRVEDFRQDQLYLTWPSKKGQNVMIALGDPASLTISTQDSRGRQAATLYLDGEVVDRLPATSDNPVPMIVIKVLAVGRQEQRGHYRLFVSLQPIDVAIWDREFGRTDEEGFWRPINAVITDVSGGGIGLTADEEMTEGARLRIRIPYPMGVSEFIADARVVKALAISAGEKTRYKIGSQFEAMSDQRRERLTRAIHRYQVEQRRRETGR